ncbi:MAG: hypothetical protein V7L04_24550, partial [Nostoc sp.]|uniref:hypothetical protein n=1 Tax=Nostoc sp. TaxID=1180 RepID=UPI002FF7D6A2
LGSLLVRRSLMLPNSNLFVPRIWDFCKRSNEKLFDFLWERFSINNLNYFKNPHQEDTAELVENLAVHQIALE